MMTDEESRGYPAIPSHTRLTCEDVHVASGEPVVSTEAGAGVRLQTGAACGPVSVHHSLGGLSVRYFHTLPPA